MSDEKQFELPTSWSLVNLRSVIEVHYGRSLTGKNRIDSGEYPVVGSSGIVGMHNEKLVDGECIVVGRKGSVGATYLLLKPSWPIDTTYYIQTSQGLDLRYIYYLLGSLELVRLDKSTAIPGLNREDLYRVEVALAPSAEQTRIVEKLEELFSDLNAGVAELKAAQKKLVQYRQSLLKAAVEGALTAEWRKTHQPEETGAQLLERILKQRRANWEAKQLAKFQQQGKTPPKGWQDKYPEPVKPDTSDLQELPEGWVWASLDQLTEFITSGSRGWADYYADKGATFIRSQNINKDWLDLSDIAFVNPPRNSEGERTRVEQNDLLLTITGANVGKTALVNVQIEEAYVSQHVALIRLIDTRLSNYLHTFLTALAGGRGQLDKEAYGAGKPGLNLQQVKSVFVPLLPNTERNFLMENLNLQFDAINEQFSNIKHLLKQSTAQRKNILKSAFSGQLVPQDPNDEPASVLLERIRNERQHAKIPAKRSRR